MTLPLDEWWPQHQARSARNARAHCTRCGRFVSQVREHRLTPSMDLEWSGECSVHGRVDAVWQS